MPQIVAVLTALQAGIAQLQELAKEASLPPEYAAIAAKVVADIKDWLTTEATALASLGAFIVTVTILAGLLTFYLLSDGDKAFTWAVPESMGWRRAPLRAAAVDAMQRVGGYLRGSAILGIVYGATDFVFLILVGRPPGAGRAAVGLRVHGQLHPLSRGASSRRSACCSSRSEPSAARRRSCCSC